eukprot:scaffold17450_cov61-Skeletonema_dohrnii-CCMP3373.AAC.1
MTCVETDFGSYKAILVVVAVVVLIKLIVRLIQHELACGWQQGLVGTSTCAAPAHHLLHRQSRSIHHRKQR